MVGGNASKTCPVRKAVTAARRLPTWEAHRPEMTAQDQVKAGFRIIQKRSKTGGFPTRYVPAPSRSLWPGGLYPL